MTESIERGGLERPATPVGSQMNDDRFARLNERHRQYLRYAADNRKSKEIARLENVSPRSVDKVLAEAKTIIGARDRFEAARLFAAFENRGRNFPLQSSSVDDRADLRLHPPVPTWRMPVSLLKVREVLIWSAIIMVATPIGLTVSAMLMLALMILFGAHIT